MAKKILTGVDNCSQRLLNVASPSAGTDGTNKDYVDAKVEGLSYKVAVRAASTANGTLASAFENGDTIDGVTLATGDRILLKDQSAQAENGIYVVAASGAPTRAADANSSTELNQATVKVVDGSVNTGKQFTQSTKSPTVGSSNIVWAESGGGTTYTADGQGIELSSNQFALELDGTTLTKGASGLRIGSGAAGAGLVQSSGVLAVGAGTGITVNADDVAIDTSVVARKYATSVGNGASTSIAVVHNLGTRDVVTTIYYAASSYEHVEADVVSTDTNTVTVTFATAPTTNEFRVVCLG